MNVQPSLPGIEIRPTIAMRRGDSHVAQCADCGTLVCSTRPHALAACPACHGTTWWRQTLPVGPVHPAVTP